MPDEIKPTQIASLPEGALEERIAQISHPKKKQFLSLWRDTHGNITECSRASRISRRTYYEWLQTDKEFVELLAECEAELNDEMRKALIEKGADGDLGAIIFYLRKRHPDFQDRPNLTAIKLEGDDMKVEFYADEK